MFHCNVNLIREVACLCSEKIVYLHVHVPQIKCRVVSEAEKDHKLLATLLLSWLSLFNDTSMHTSMHTGKQTRGHKC